MPTANRRAILEDERLCRFAAREKFPLRELKRDSAAALGSFLEQEVMDVATGRRDTCVNCDLERLQNFSTAVGFDLRGLPDGWRRHLKLG